MYSLKILQLGDIHYPEAKADYLLDYKDKSLSPSLVHRFAPLRLHAVIREVLSLWERCKPTSLLLCGDLTSKGDLAQYGPCVDYLIQSLGLGADKWPAESVHAVPGNHDIDPKECDSTGADLFKKFVPLTAAWTDRSFPIFSPNDIRTTPAITDDCRVHIFSMNSCIGCRERRSLPSAIETQLKDILDKYHATHLAGSFPLLGEQLDTPAFLSDHIDSLLEQAGKLPESAVPVVLAHHNILPQAIPRVSIYTDVINGGLIRSRFAGTSRPVIYCHGHIHEDPIEIVHSPKHPNGKLVCIAARQLRDGFNLLDFSFSRGRVPLGLTITQYVVRNNGAVEPESPIRIPLVLASDVHHLASSSLATSLAPLTARWDYFEDIRARLNAGTSTVTDASLLADDLNEGEWFGMVQIENRERPHRQWVVRRVMP